jgi:hypothetical protein
MNWEVSFAKLEGQPVDCMASIAHHDRKILSNVLAPFLDEARFVPESQDAFYKSTRYIATTIADTFNRHCIRQLVDFNFTRGKYPKLMVRRIGEWEDIRTMTFATRNLVGAQMLTPDDDLEEWVRDQLFLPPMNKDSSRITTNISQVPVDPNNPNPQPTTPAGGLTPPSSTVPVPGPPKQKASPPVGTPQGNTGADRSGG